ncbi:S8/S53 family peptidase [Streptomyces erythrochromogenes]|uniref:S8/S53 family peptidase n=1 Tax=Streptomyces erythrochromogenes TaxID=285574 RepID=UPI002253DA02|nr:S8/S53 family peptidase [Streptomyces erythrochromogenes]MCX5583440.1 S8/S53 family peptidase [Streptomyces erythrochromogenes]
MVPGQVVFGHPSDGPGAGIADRVTARLREDEVFRSLTEKLTGPGSSVGHLDFSIGRKWSYGVQLIGVRRGQELEAVDRINDLILEETVHAAGEYSSQWADVLVESGNRVMSQPVHYVHPLKDALSAEPFSFTTTHQQYIDALNVATEWPAEQSQPAVAVLDGGFSWSRYRDQWGDGGQICDDRSLDLVKSAPGTASALTHGTLVSLLALSVCPSAHIFPVRIFGDPAISDGRAATEWLLMHALKVALDRGAQVINISMGFGLDDVECPACGTMARTTRSTVLEFLIAHAVRSTTDERPIVVSAAGNDGIGLLNFPARYQSSVAVSSVNSLGNRSQFSNFDGTGHHPLLFAAPGGDSEKASDEWLAESRDRRYRGTSFAAGYVSGLIAHVFSVRNNASVTEVLGEIGAAADSSRSNYDVKYHGKGIVHSS